MMWSEGGMDIYSTEQLYDYVARSESVDEYKNIVVGLKSQQDEWKTVINNIMTAKGYNASQFAKVCRLSRQSVQKWMNGSVPRSRDTFLRIGFAAEYDIDEMNFFLQRYGRCNKLYARNLEDSVCIFVLMSNVIEHTYEKYEEIIRLIKAEFAENDNNESEVDEVYDTSSISFKITSLESVAQMLEFVHNTAYVFKQQYLKFYNYVEEFIQKNLINDETNEDNVFLLANSQQWSSSLRQCVSEISQKKWYPQRNKIISLGIHLNMRIDQMNTMLELAQMEPLCAKNPFESVIIYALENAELEGIISCDGTDELCLYVKRILMSLNLEPFEFFMDELPDEESDE